MEFTKIQGAGNDFIIINNMELKLPVEKLSYIANRLCTRKISLGADGFMAVDYADANDADFRMRFFNSDGSIGEMCGNGARCIARFAYLNNIAGKKMKFETTAGIVWAEIEKGRQVKVKLNRPEVIKLKSDLDVDGIKYECSYIELGNPGLPHAVVKYPGLADEDKDKLFDIGRKIRYHKSFPKGANVNFYEVTGNDSADVKTYERGVEDFTLACGTGSGSVAAVLCLKNYVKSDAVKIHVPGGELLIKMTFEDDNIEELFLIGDTNIIAKGEIMDEDIIV